MKKILKQMVAVLSAVIFAFGILIPVTPVMAASKNKVLEIPVNFSNTTWEKHEEDSSKSFAVTYGWGNDSIVSSNYNISYDLYIPSSFMKNKESMVRFSCTLELYDAETQKLKGWFNFPYAEFQADGSITAWDMSRQEHVPVDFAMVRKAGDFYVITYNVASAECSKPELVNQSGKIDIGFNFGIQGINIKAEDCAIYLDNVKITNDDGNVITNQNFSSDNTITGMNYIHPDGEHLIAVGTRFGTITNNKIMTVKPSKATVKVGKTAKISAVASPMVKITYSSSNKKVATVNSQGIVTGKKAGKATITIKANGKTVKVAITVKNK